MGFIFLNFQINTDKYIFIKKKPHTWNDNVYTHLESVPLDPFDRLVEVKLARPLSDLLALTSNHFPEK